MVSIDKNMKKNSWLRQHFTINKKLLPLKFTLFFFSASAFSILPYLTIHMKDIGIKVEHIALMYAVLPFTIFLGKYVDLINIILLVNKSYLESNCNGVIWPKYGKKQIPRPSARTILKVRWKNNFWGDKNFVRS